MSTYSTNIPGAPGYEQANLLARRAYENAMNRLSQRRSRSLQSYGYTRDDAGNLSVDPNNEYGQYQQMLRGENQQSHGLERAQHASGWGSGSGYFGAQRDELQHAQGGEQARLGTSLADELAGISQDETDAAYTRDQNLYGNMQDATREAINQGNFNPADYGGIDVPYGDQPDQPAPPRGRGGGNVHRQGRERLLRHAVRRGRRR